MTTLISILSLLAVAALVACIILFRKASKAKKAGMSAPPYKKPAIICLVVFLVSFICVGFLGEPVEKNENKETSVEQSASVSSDSSDSKDVLEGLLSENERLLKEMEPKKEELKAYIISKIPSELQDEKWFFVEANLSIPDAFSISIQIDIHSNDKEYAKSLAESLCEAFDNPPYTIDSYDFMMVNKGASVAWLMKSSEDESVEEILG